MCKPRSKSDLLLLWEEFKDLVRSGKIHRSFPFYMSILLEIILKCPSSRTFICHYFSSSHSVMHKHCIKYTLYYCSYSFVEESRATFLLPSSPSSWRRDRGSKMLLGEATVFLFPVKYPLWWIYLKVDKRESLFQHLLPFDIEAFPKALSTWLKEGSQCYLCMSYVMLLLLDDSVFCSQFATHLTHREKIIPCFSVSKFSSRFLRHCKFGVKFNHCQQSSIWLAKWSKIKIIQTLQIFDKSASNSRKSYEYTKPYK